jgi:hypothetical protein
VRSTHLSRGFIGIGPRHGHDAATVVVLNAAWAEALLPQVSIESHFDICAARIALTDA